MYDEWKSKEIDSLPTCSHHLEMTCEYYCTDCDAFTCSDCIILSKNMHENHFIIKSRTKYNEIKSQFQHQLGEIRHCLESHSKYLESLKELHTDHLNSSHAVIT